jgi:hypothetical protein
MKRHKPFGPDVIRLAYELNATAGPPDNEIIDLLEHIHARHPALTFRNFLGACVLAHALAMRTEGSA